MKTYENPERQEKFESLYDLVENEMSIPVVSEMTPDIVYHLAIAVMETEQYGLFFDDTRGPAVIDDVVKNIPSKEAIAERLEKVATKYPLLCDYLGKLADLEDNHYTLLHSFGVACESLRVAGVHDFSKTDLDNLALGSLGHDVGKIGVMDIITADRKLDDEEYEATKMHSELSAYLLRKADMPEAAIEIAKNHHERLDGSGYDHHLTAKDISEGAKIIAIADSMDALTRPGRPGKNPEGIPIGKSLDNLIFDRYRDIPSLGSTTMDGAVDTVSALKEKGKDTVMLLMHGNDGKITIIDSENCRLDPKYYSTFVQLNRKNLLSPEVKLDELIKEREAAMIPSESPIMSSALDSIERYMTGRFIESKEGGIEIRKEGTYLFCPLGIKKYDRSHVKEKIAPFVDAVEKSKELKEILGNSWISQEIKDEAIITASVAYVVAKSNIGYSQDTAVEIGKNILRSELSYINKGVDADYNLMFSRDNTEKMSATFMGLPIPSAIKNFASTYIDYMMKNEIMDSQVYREVLNGLIIKSDSPDTFPRQYAISTITNARQNKTDDQNIGFEIREPRYVPLPFIHERKLHTP